MGTSKLQNTNHLGVRYRLHPSRKNGVQFDRYFTIRHYVDGKRIEEGVGWASEKWTAAKAAELRPKLQRNARTGKGPRTLAEMRKQGELEREKARRETDAQAKLDISFKKFFDDVFFPDAQARWKPQTARKAGEHINNWIDPITSDTPMGKIGLSHIKKIRAEMVKKGSSPRQQQYVFRTFSMVWDAARDEKLVNGPSPTKAKSFILPKVDNEKQRYLTYEEEKKLLDAINKRSESVHDMAVISLDCGLRFGEIASLSWGCIDLDQGVILVMNTKGKDDRIVPMTGRVKSLFEMPEEDLPKDLIFPTKEGLRQKQVPSSFVRAVADAKLNDGIDDKKMKASFHTLRHTYASRMVQAGVDLYRVQRLLGHSTPLMTARYSKLANTDLKAAVEAMERAKKVKEGDGKVVPFKRR